MMKRILITIRLSENDDGNKIKEDIMIMTKHDIFKLPIEAQIVSRD